MKIFRKLFVLLQSVLFLFLFVDSVNAGDTINMIKDINKTENYTNIDYLIISNGTKFFRANDTLHGFELWRSDGSAEGTVMVKDIYPGTSGSTVSGLTDYNNTVYFSANDGVNGYELWKSDGTVEGTIMIKDIYSGSGSSTPSKFIVYGSYLFFSASNSTYGYELWKTDGTTDGTALVKDINTGSSSSSPDKFFISNGTLYFTATTSSNGRELYKTDGTTSGTVLLKDINSGTNSSDPEEFIDFSGVMYFRASTTTNGLELWKTDGTASGTVLVKDIYPGSSSSVPYSFIVFNGKLYFSANDGVNGYELWESNGTSGGTTLVKDLFTGSSSSSPAYLTVLGTNIIFRAINENGIEIWKSDGTAGGTSMLKDINSGSLNSWPEEFLLAGSYIYFRATTTTHGYELWKTDGTLSGTVMVKDLYTGSIGSSPRTLLSEGTTLYFSADDGINGSEFWKTDGTSVGTVMIKNINTTTQGSNPSTLMKLDKYAIFAATSSSGRELWRTDKSESGTVLIKDINPGSANSNPSYMVIMGENVYFQANDGVNGAELWKSDGTTSGTVMLKDINPGSSGSSPDTLIYNENLNIIFFLANDGSGVGNELWRTDGTVAGTYFLKDVNTGSSRTYIQASITYGQKSIFTIYNPSYGYEPWISDGTITGTNLLKDIFPGTGSGSSHPDGYIEYNGIVYFGADDNEHGYELWKTDGTSAGTTLFLDIDPAILWSGPASGYPGSKYVYNNEMLLSANGELWKSNGTVAGTNLLKDINPGLDDYSWPTNWRKFQNEIFFSALINSVGTELFKTDGTATGTVLIKDINPGLASSNPSNMLVVNDRLYFTADDGITGKELWVSDGTSAGTQIAIDVYQGAISSDPRIIKFNDDIVVTATLTEYGRELFWVQLPPNPPFGIVSTALSTSSIRLTWTDIAKSENSFNIYLSLDGTNYTKIDSIAKDLTEYTMTGLTANTKYWIKLSAQNEKGQSYTEVFTRYTRSSYSDLTLTSQHQEEGDLCNISASWLGNSSSYALSYDDITISNIANTEYIIEGVDCNKKYEFSLVGSNGEGVSETAITAKIKTVKRESTDFVPEDVDIPVYQPSDKNTSDVEGTSLIDSVIDFAKGATTVEFANQAQEVALATGLGATLIQPAVGGVSMIANTFSLSNIFVLLGQAINNVLIFFGIKKREREFGYVYDSITKSPISLAIVRFYNNTGELVGTSVTNSFGIFETNLKEGIFKLSVSKAGYEYPSQIVLGSTDGEIMNVYQGQDLDVSKQNISNFSIPLDPVDADMTKTKLKKIVLLTVKYISFALFVIGFIYSSYILYTSVTLYNVVILMIYSFILHQYVLAWMYANRSGKVKRDGKALEGVKVGLKLNSLDKIVDVRVTDDDGKFKFIATPGEYEIVLNDKRYIEEGYEKELFTVTGDKPQVIYRDINIR